MTLILSLKALFYVFGLLGLGLILWGLIQRFRGSPPDVSTTATANQIDADQAEGLLAVCTGVALLITAGAFRYLATG